MPKPEQNDPVQQARFALSTSPEFALRGLHVEADGDRLLISGRVATFYHKQLAQEVVRSVADGKLVVNSVQVVESEPRHTLPPRDEPACARF